VGLGLVCGGGEGVLDADCSRGVLVKPLLGIVH
jgi:hypothetical protein